MQPKIRNIQDILFLYEAYHGNSRVHLYTGYIFVDAEDNYYSGRADKPKLQMTIKDYNDGLSLVPDEKVYPSVREGVAFTAFPNNITGKHLYFKRPTQVRAISYSMEERLAQDHATRTPQTMLEEIRNLDYLSKLVSHPALIKYHGCRVHRGFITSIVVDRHDSDIGRLMSVVRVSDDDDLSLPGRIMGSREKDPDVRFGNEGFFDEVEPSEEPRIDKQRFMATIREAVACLHAVGWAHNTIRPANVLVNKEGLPVLASFESCRPVGEKLKFTRGMKGWIENDDHASYTTSEFKHDLYALDKLDEWLGEQLEMIEEQEKTLAEKAAARELDDKESSTLYKA